MTRKRKCHSKSNSFVAVAEQVCLQPVLEHRQRRGRRNIAWKAVPHTRSHRCSCNDTQSQHVARSSQGRRSSHSVVAVAVMSQSWATLYRVPLKPGRLPLCVKKVPLAGYFRLELFSQTQQDLENFAAARRSPQKGCQLSSTELDAQCDRLSWQYVRSTTLASLWHWASTSVCEMMRARHRVARGSLGDSSQLYLLGCSFVATSRYFSGVTSHRQPRQCRGIAGGSRCPKR